MTIEKATPGTLVTIEKDGEYYDGVITSTRPTSTGLVKVLLFRLDPSAQAPSNETVVRHINRVWEVAS